MLLSKEVEVRWNGKTKKWYEEKGYTFTKINDLFKVKVEDVTHSCTATVKVKCDYCGKEYECKILKYYAHKSGINKKDCCNNCKSKKADETLMLKYGVNHNTQLDNVKNKLSENLRTEFNIINKNFEDKGLHIVKDNFKYINDRQKIPFICDKHYDKGIQYTTYFNIKQRDFSACGCKYCRYEKISKENNYRWNGGISDLSKYLRSKIQDWKNETLKYYNYKSIFTDNRDNLIIHHLNGFDNILYECLNNLKLDIKQKVSDYTNDELDCIVIEINRLHELYGTGILLDKPIHDIFHINYGYGKNNKIQFIEFLKRYFNNEFDDYLENEYKAINSNISYEEVIRII